MNFTEYTIDVIKHEVGHWVVAKILGFKTGDITIQITHNGKLFGHEASANIRPEPEISNITDISSYLENRICILFAGVISQAIGKTDISETSAADLLLADGASDYAKVTELVFICRGIKFYGEICEQKEIEHRNVIMGEYWKKAGELVQRSRDYIIFISKKIECTVVQPSVTYIIPHYELVTWFDSVSA